MKAIVGLGNPGFRYKATRHNVGFMVADRLAQRSCIKLRERLFWSLCGRGSIGGKKAILAKPLTYMNLSGKAVRDLINKSAIGTEDLLIILDDKDIELGRIKLKTRGSGGSHNGLVSIIGELGTEEFSRLKIGIGSQRENALLRDHVLTPFKRNERKLLGQTIEQACQCVEAWVSAGAAAAMNRYNT